MEAQKRIYDGFCGDHKNVAKKPVETCHNPKREWGRANEIWADRRENCGEKENGYDVPVTRNRRNKDDKNVERGDAEKERPVAAHGGAKGDASLAATLKHEA